MNQECRSHQPQPYVAPPNQIGFWEGIKSYLETARTNLSAEDTLNLLARATADPTQVKFDRNSARLPVGAHSQMWARLQLFLQLARLRSWSPEQTLEQLALAANGNHDKLIEPCQMLICASATLIPYTNVPLEK